MLLLHNFASFVRWSHYDCITFNYNNLPFSTNNCTLLTVIPATVSAQACVGVFSTANLIVSLLLSNHYCWSKVMNYSDSAVHLHPNSVNQD